MRYLQFVLSILLFCNTAFAKIYYYEKPIKYQDYYTTYFWEWIQKRSLEEKALWAFHHQERMDKKRYDDFIKKDQRIEPMIDLLKRAEVKIDPHYKPNGIDEFMIYTVEFQEDQGLLLFNGFLGVIGLLVILFTGLKFCGI